MNGQKHELLLVKRIKLEIITGDIVDQPDCDAIVNAANAQLRTGGGVAGAIHKIGDPELATETRKHAPIKPGEAVITSAPNLPNKNIVHCLGPVYGRDKPEDKLLANCYRNALTLADEYGLQAIAFPAISTGAFGYPVEEAADVSMKTIAKTANRLNSINRIRIVLWNDRDWVIYKEKSRQFQEN